MCSAEELRAGAVGHAVAGNAAAHSKGAGAIAAADSMAASSAEDAARSWYLKHDALLREIVERQERRAVAHARGEAARRRAWGDFCEASEGCAVWWMREGWTAEDVVAFAGGDAWLLQTMARFLRGRATRRVNRAQQRLLRPSYYEAERARRAAWAAERRRIRQRRTENPCPTREAILEAWTHVRESDEALIRFGSLIEDLACYVDSSLRRDEDGVIVGRNGGVKEWLRENIPALYLVYSSVIRYKNAARKLRQVTGVADPVPASRIVAERPREDERVEGVRARAVYLELTTPRPASRTAFLARLEAWCDPERVEEGTVPKDVRARYAAAITVRNKKSWARRLWKKRRKRAG